jgi:hypothetical protein
LPLALVWCWYVSHSSSLDINSLRTLHSMKWFLFLSVFLILRSHQVEEEFREYIAAYVDMLHQVNEMEDCLEVNSLLIQYFTPKFPYSNLRFAKRIYMIVCLLTVWLFFSVGSLW